MLGRKWIENKLIFHISCTLIILIACFSVVSFLTSKFSFSDETDELWDGVRVASSFFAGNGTQDNPYLIHNGEELAYFKQLIEGENSALYTDKYYALAADIDLNFHEWTPIGIEVDGVLRIFRGHFDGRGYVIRNGIVRTPAIFDQCSMYGFFSVLENASIEHLNFDHIEISPQGEDTLYKAGVLAAEVRTMSSDDSSSFLGKLANISIADSQINLSRDPSGEGIQVGGVASAISSSMEVYNLFVEVSFSSTSVTHIAKVAYQMESSSHHIVTKVSGNNLKVDAMQEYELLADGCEMTSYGTAFYQDGNLTFVFQDSEKILSDVLLAFHENLDLAYYWYQEDSVLRIGRVSSPAIASNVLEDPVIYNFAFGRSTSIVLHDTGITDTTVYINDLESDYNYYKGLNYTYSDTGLLPSGNNQNLYNDNNLAKIYVKYSGVDINNSNNIGYVSLDERQSEFIYYKYYPVENGYVEFELIDNPFAARPNDLVFNGWVTDFYGAEVSINTDEYIRTVRIPVTDISTPISITFYANWTDGNIIHINSNTSWRTIENSLDNAGLKQFGQGNPIYEDVDMRNYFIYGGELSYRDTYPSGAYDSEGNYVSGNRCTSFMGGCTYYLKSSSAEYDPSQTYYEPVTTGTGWWQETTMEEFVPEIIGYEPSETLPEGSIVAGYFREITLQRNESVVGYYNQNGTIETTGTCTNWSGCTYYEYINYYDDNGNVEVVDSNENYYYLVTRDTNIAVLQTSYSNDIENSKPVTITGIHNGNTYISNARINLSNSYIYLNADLRLEYVTLNGNYITQNDASPTSSSSSASYIYGNWNNLKIGRGIRRYNNNVNARGVLGGGNNAAGNSNSVEKYRLIIESGLYNNFSVTNGTSSRTMYVEGIATYGSDYDRVNGNNDNLEIYARAAGTWGGSVYASTNVRAATTTIVKSGSFGTGRYDYATGIYVGGLSGGTNYAARVGIVEGGWIYNLLGGPLTAENRTDINDTFINVKGGSVDMIIGGAGASETYGNRIINVTGGTVNYSVFGGSNGYTGGDNDSNYKGTLSGSTLVYVGGTATVGNPNYISSNSQIFGVTSGNVFGIGNGNSGSTQVGSADNSNIIIDGNAKILQNVYGGGNYGATGLVPYQTQNGTKNSTTNIKILGGTVTGGVYGGGNNNGSGGEATYEGGGWWGTTYTTTVSSTINIEMFGGRVGSIYGGSRVKGIAYGDTNVSILGGSVLKDVYGGGEGGYQNSSNPGTFVEKNVNVVIGNSTSYPTITGSVYGGSAYGTVNGTTNNGSATDQYVTNVTVNNAIIQQSVYGGGKGSSEYTPKVYGNVTVTIHGGNIGNVFGGNDASGSPSNGDVVYLNGGVIGNAFGGGNDTGQELTNIYLQGATVTNLFGGSNSSGTVNTSHVTMTSGTVTNIYGGNNIGGITDVSNVLVQGGTVLGDIYGGGSLASTNESHVTLEALTVHNVYGGGERADCTTTDISVFGTTVDYLFGGSNFSGDVSFSNVLVHSGTIDRVYGGNNQGGVTTTTNVTIESGTVTDVYGGGDHASSSVSNIQILDGNIQNVYGGGNEAGLTTSNVSVVGGQITNVFGGSNASGDLTSANVLVGSKNSLIDLAVQASAVDTQSWQTSEYSTYVTFDVTLTNLTDQDISDWQIRLAMPSDSVIANNWSSSDFSIDQGIALIDSVNRYDANRPNTLTANGGTYTFTFYVYSNVSKDDFSVTSKVLQPTDTSSSSISIGTVYGGNNQGGVTTSPKVVISSGSIGTVYGGGNAASVDVTEVLISDASVGTVFGGGNAAGVQSDTYVDIDDALISGNIYGGGNEGTVSGDTSVFFTNTSVLGSAYAGGNGSTAIVYGNTSITVDGKSVVGSDTSSAPHAGCVFGGGNAAATGRVEDNSSTATVNISGAHIYGNVYGGANTSVVYGKTFTNIGTEAIGDLSLQEDDVKIQGTVFGGGEANASGSEIYDYSFISVTGAIDIQINGKGYLDRGHLFTLSGSIFGSGNASSSSGTSNIFISYLGTKAQPSQNISIQRANTVTIDRSYIELEGTTDRTNEYSTIKYSFNRIDSLTIKNNTTLLLQQNANLLQEFHSAVDVGGELEKAEVIIDDDTKTVTKNVDNRIYLVPNRNLNITTNEAATSYGKVTGMTFFGMYNSYSSGSFSYGVYDSSFNYGDSADAGDVIIGGSYVLGLHSLNHDITVDGFYSNYLNDDYTEVTTAYIEPTPPDSNYYMWTIGTQAINYSFALNASKYSSLGTYELSMLDFSNGDTIFNVIGFNSEGLASGVSLIDSNLVPKVTNTAEEANQVLGLSMKSETREWTSYGVTKLLSENGGTYTGTTNYKTDSQTVAPSLMFYLYHAKNITLDGELGTVVVSLQALTPINEIEYDVQLITITIDITARNYDDDDAYDASITYDKKYEMPSATSVNITNQSQFTAYYSLFAYADTLDDFYGPGNTNYHVLTTNYALPVGTQITMLDYGVSQTKPEYYYYTVTEESYQIALQQLATDNEITYRLSDFVKMGSTSLDNTYDDASANLEYYSEQYGRTIEEFLFIFDFKATDTTGTHLDNYILFELRNHEDRALVSVLGIRQNLMYYNLYDTSNVVLNESVQASSNYLYYDVAMAIDYSTLVAYDQTSNRESIINTNYESNSMGLNVSIFDQSMNQVSSSLLSGTSIRMDGNTYFADSDGVYRIQLAGKVSNLNRTIYLTTDELLPPGQYTLRFVLFASPDGLHNSHALESASFDVLVTVVGNNNSISVLTNDKSKVVDGETSLNMLGYNYNRYTLTYQSEISNPNVRISLYKRSVESKMSSDYEEIDFRDLFANNLRTPESLHYVSGSDYERMLDVEASKSNVLSFQFNDSLTSGTYRLVFRLYDNNQLIEEEIEYVIVKKKMVGSA